MNKKKEQLDAAREMLRAAGLRATPGRIALLNYLSGLKSPVSHQEVCDDLEDLGSEKSTLFRALRDLVQAGLARRMELGDHVWRYELAKAEDEAGEAGPVHPHLLCVDCGRITCLTEDEVELAVDKSVGPIEEVLLKGHCATCLDVR